MKRKYTLEQCKEDALRFKSRSEWRSSSAKLYRASIRYHYLEKCCAHMKVTRKLNNYWTLETCREDALKYKYQKEWKDNSSAAYSKAYDCDWLEECCTHMKRPDAYNKYITLEMCVKSALKYNMIKLWQLHEQSTYQAAHRNGWLKECCKHMILLQKPNGYWTLERCKEDALKCKTRSEWFISIGSGYHAASKNSWLEECCKHMKRSNGASSYEQDMYNFIKSKFPKVQKLRIIAKNVFFNKPHIKGFDIDIYIPELRKGIEFNGDYWHSDKGLKRSRSHWPQEDIDNYHQLKKSFFSSKGIEYIEIWESDWIKNPQTCIDRCLTFLKTI